MKSKKWCLAVLMTLCFGFLLGGTLLFASAAGPVYTKVGSLEGKITASSTLNGDTADKLAWELSKLANAGRGDWSVQWGYTSNPSADEWVQIDMTVSKTIGKIVLHNEGKKSYARKFVVYGSEDKSSWYELARYENGDEGWKSGAVELEFAAAKARYVKISLCENGQNDANLVALSNIEIYETDQAAQSVKGYTDAEISMSAETKALRAETTLTLVQPVSVTSSGSWTNSSKAENACDRNYKTSWIAPWGYSSHKYADEYICYDLGESKLIGKVRYWAGTVNVPQSIRILVSEDGENWGVLSRVDDPKYNAKNCFAVVFDSIRARYVKTEIFLKGANGENYLAGFTEVEVFETNDATAAGTVDMLREKTGSIADTLVSSTTAPNTKDKLLDSVTANKNTQSNYWMSSVANTAVVDASKTALGFDGFAFAFAEKTKLDALWLFPRFDGNPGESIGFPISFTLMYSENGQEWYRIRSYENYQVLAGWNEFVFPGTVEAKYIGVSVQERGKNGEAYTVEMAEAKLFAYTEERAAFTGELALDTSRIEVTQYQPADFVYTYTEFRLKLSDYFKYSLNKELEYTADGAGEIAASDGEQYFVLTPKEKGTVSVHIMCVPKGKESPSAELSFELKVITKDDPDVIAKTFLPELTYAVGVTFRVDLNELFVYEGKEKLVYTTNKGAIVSDAGGDFLVFTPAEAGENKITVTAVPGGKEDKKAENTITVLTVAAPAPSPEQPPVYHSEGGCGSMAAGSGILFSACALLATVLVIRRKKRS